MTAPIENFAGKSETEYRLFMRSLDDGGLLAQELIQKGAMHVVEFLLSAPGNTYDNLKKVKQSLAWHAMIISEECGRRGLPVVPHQERHG